MAIRLLDTNIVSFVMKAHSLATKYQPHLTGHTLAISFMSVAEMLEGAARAGWGPARMATLLGTIANLLVLQSDQTLCEKWAEVRIHRRT